MGIGKAILLAGCIAAALVAATWFYRERLPELVRLTADETAPRPPATQPAPDKTALAALPHTPGPSLSPAPNPAKRSNASGWHLADNPQALGAAAAGLKLWEPETPATLAGSFDGSDKSLVQWLSDWQQRFAAGTADQSPYMGNLQSALNKSKLAPDQYVQLAHAVSKWEDTASDATAFQPPYHAVTSAFARCAIWKASAEIHADPDSFNGVQTVVAPLIRRLWWGKESDLSKASPDLLAVQEFYTLLEQFSPRGSSDQHRGTDGRIETMIVCHDFAGAESQARAAMASSPNRSADQTADFAYLEGWSLYYLGRYEDAARFLRVAVDRPNCEKCGRAFRLLVLARARMGDVEGSSTALKIWVDRFHPAARDAMAIFSSIDQMASNTAGTTRLSDTEIH